MACSINRTEIINNDCNVAVIGFNFSEYTPSGNESGSGRFSIKHNIKASPNGTDDSSYLNSWWHWNGITGPCVYYGYDSSYMYDSNKSLITYVSLYSCQVATGTDGSGHYTYTPSSGSSTVYSIGGRGCGPECASGSGSSIHKKYPGLFTDFYVLDKMPNESSAYFKYPSQNVGVCFLISGHHSNDSAKKYWFGPCTYFKSVVPENISEYTDYVAYSDYVTYIDSDTVGTIITSASGCMASAYDNLFNSATGILTTKTDTILPVLSTDYIPYIRMASGTIDTSIVTPNAITWGNVTAINNSDIRVFGNFGFISSDPVLSNSYINNNSILNNGYNRLFFNNSKASYYVEATGSFIGNDASTESSIEVISAYIPSYRFGYNVSNGDNQFYKTYTYTGKYAIPVPTANLSQEAKSLIKESSAIDDTSWESVDDFLDVASDPFEYPIWEVESGSVIKHMSWKDNNNNYFFSCDPVYLYEDSPEIDRYFIKSANLYYFNPNTAYGSSPSAVLDVGVFHDNNSIVMCYNSVPSTVANDDNYKGRYGGKIGVPAGIANLKRIRGLSVNPIEFNGGDNDFNSTVETKWMIDDKEINPSLGTFVMSTYNVDSVTAVYENIDSSIDDGDDEDEEDDEEGLWWEEEPGKYVFTDVRDLNQIKIHGGGNGDVAAIRIDTDFSSFIEDQIGFLQYDNKQEMVNAISQGVPTVSGYNIYFTNGYPKDIYVKEFYDSAPDASASPVTQGGYLHYNLYDSITWDAEIKAKIEDSQQTVLKQLLHMESSGNIAIEIPEFIKIGWYLWINKSLGDVDNTIYIDVLDAVGLDPQTGKWENVIVPDISEDMILQNGTYSSNPSEFATIMSLEEAAKKNYERIKVRFRLACDSSAIHLDPNGFEVNLGCRLMYTDAINGKQYSDYEIYSNRMNPIPKKCDFLYFDSDFNSSTMVVPRNFDREYYCSVKKRCDRNNHMYGNVFGSETIHPSGDMKTLVKCDFDYYDGNNEYMGKDTRGLVIPDDGEIGGWSNYATNAWNISHIENPSSAVSLISSAGIYYLETSWDEPSVVINERIKCDVHRRRGVYYHKLDNMNSSVSADSVIVWDSCIWDGSYGVYKNNESLQGSSATFPNSSNNKEFSIYNIPVSIGSNEIALCMQASASDNYIARFEYDDSKVEQLSTHRKTIKLEKDKMNVTYDSDGNPVYETTIFVSDASRVSQDDIVPTMYSTWNKVNFPGGKYRYDIKTGFYPTNALLTVRTRDFEPVSFNSEEHIYPEKQSSAFFLVNGFENFGFSAIISFGDNKSHEFGNNALKLDRCLNNWDFSLIRDGLTRWDTDPENNNATCYLQTNNSNISYIRLIADNDDSKVGFVKYNTKNNVLRYKRVTDVGYSIVIDGNVRVVLFSAAAGEGSGSVSPIWVSVEPSLYFMNNVIGYNDPIVVLNDTDNRNSIYSNYVLMGDNGQNFCVDAGDKVAIKCADYTGDNDILFRVTGKLTGGWLNNHQKLEEITSVNKIVLHVVDNEKYDENVDRVLGGPEPKYPYGRDEILFSPNEWVTADNINLRFERIFKDMEYFKSHMRFYKRPPRKYCGYFGDFNYTANGNVTRIKGGYASVDDLIIYSKFNENNSIDDDDSYFKGCRSICVDIPEDIDCESGEEHTSGLCTSMDNVTVMDRYANEDIGNNLYVCVGDKIRIVSPVAFAGETRRDDIVPKKINEFMNDITRIEFSNDTNRLYCLSTKTHKVYIFNRFNNGNLHDPQNACYYGEIGGYGGPTARSKFNNPTDICINKTERIIEGEKKIVEELWVCDTGNNAVKHYTIKGQWISTIDLSELEYKIIGCCADYKNQLHILTDSYVFTFDADGNPIRVFELKSGEYDPIMIKAQCLAGFLYVLYKDHVSKYNLEGEFIGSFAQTDTLTYTCICSTNNHDLYIGTTKNILHYSDKLSTYIIGAVENADDYAWKKEEIYLDRNENIQDVILNTSMQRMYDNVMMYSICSFGKILDVVSDNEEDYVADFDKATRDKILDMHRKDHIFVGINELVTVDVINRCFGQIYDLMDAMLKTI